jgi:RND family efflux transporter MFP subunit
MRLLARGWRFHGRDLPPLAVALLLAACGSHEADAGTADSTAAPVVGAQTAVATRQPFAETVNAIGTVMARPGKIAALAPPAATRVMHIFVAVGQRVAAGAPLVEFDRAPFDAEARSAEAALTAAQHGYDRAKRLVDAGILARKDLDQAGTDLAQAEANAVAARRAQAYATLRAPIAGVVTHLDAVLSGAVDPSRTVVEVADPNALDLVFTTSPGDAARIRPGAAVRVTAGQQATGEALGTGSVLDVAATVDTTSRGVAVRARLERPTRPLRIGETVFGQITVATNPNAVTVPIAALVPEGEGYKVFVVDASRHAHATPVSVGARTQQLAEITRGLEGGETVVTSGAYGVQDSATVVPITTAPGAPAPESAGAEKGAGKGDSAGAKP